MKRLFLILFVFVAVSAFAQDRPHNTLEQCQIAGMLYSSVDGQFAADSLPFAELDRRVKEMAYCVIDFLPVAATRDKQNWSGAESYYSVYRERRLQAFIKRHGQMDQFLREDMAGAR
jgi:hypothetical protein